MNKAKVDQFMKEVDLFSSSCLVQQKQVCFCGIYAKIHYLLKLLFDFFASIWRVTRFRDNQFGRCGLNKLIIRRMSANPGGVNMHTYDGKRSRSLLARGFAAFCAALSVAVGLSAWPAEAAPFAYVVNQRSTNVSVIDTATNKVVKTEHVVLLEELRRLERCRHIGPLTDSHYAVHDSVLRHPYGHVKPAMACRDKARHGRFRDSAAFRHVFQRAMMVANASLSMRA
jgi:hypothetical protein